MEDQKVEIEPEHWTKLRELYDSENYLTLSTLQNYIRWSRNEPKEDLKIYSLNGDWSDGTFVIVDLNQIFVSSLDVSNGRLFKLLLLLDYSKGARFVHIPSKYYPTILDVVKLKELAIEKPLDILLYRLPKEKALKLEAVVPDDLFLRPLTTSDVIIANDDWPYKHPGSLVYLQSLARLNPNCGLFTRDGELISCAFQFQTGSLGVLQTKETHRGRGLAKIVVKSIFKQTAELGQDAYAGVTSVNVASRAVFEKIGCEVVDTVHRINTICE